jgi:alanine dehydrogenase
MIILEEPAAFISSIEDKSYREKKGTDIEKAGQEAWAANKAVVALKGKGMRKECFEGQRHTPENKGILGNIHFGIMWTKQSA